MEIEDRLDSLEKEHSDIKEALNNLSEAVSSSEKTISSIEVKLDSHYKEEQKYETTIRNIDDNVNDIKIELAKAPMVRNRELKEVLDPIWSAYRELKDSFMRHKLEEEKVHTECAENTKNDIRREFKTYVVIAWTCLILSGVLVGYMYTDLKQQVNNNTVRIK